MILVMKRLTLFSTLICLFLGCHKQEALLGELSTGYYENGNRKEEGHLKNGKKEDKWFKWYESSQLESETNYKNGQHHGKDQGWYANGK